MFVERDMVPAEDVLALSAFDGEEVVDVAYGDRTVLAHVMVHVHDLHLRDVTLVSAVRRVTNCSHESVVRD